MTHGRSSSHFPLKMTLVFTFVAAIVNGVYLYAAVPEIRVVATSLEPGFQTIDPYGLSINASGLTAFRSSAGRVWSEAGGIRQIVADQGTNAAGTSANFGSSFDYPPAINSQGDIAFYGALDGGDANAFNNRGIWFGRKDSLSLVARTGDHAPGLPANVNYSSFAKTTNPTSWTLVNLNNQGNVAFGAFVAGPGIEVNRSHGIWAGSPGNLRLVAMENQLAPGGIGTFIGMGEPVINNVGRVGFKCTVAPSVGDPYSGIFTEIGGITSIVAKGIDPAPGGGTGVKFYSIPSEPVINDAGNIAFSARTTRHTFSTNDAGVWVFRNGSLQKVAVTGDSAPGTTTQFSYAFGEPVINAQGRTAFTARIAAPFNSTDEAIWSEGRTGVLEKIAQHGQQAPGLPAGYLFDGDFQDPVLNSTGRIAFMARVTNISNTYGIWAQDKDFNLQLIFLDGNQVPGSGISAITTVGELDFLSGSGNQDGRRSGFNDLGQVAFKVGFTSGTIHGGFVSNLVAIPEPPIVSLLGILCLMISPPRFRRELLS